MFGRILSLKVVYTFMANLNSYFTSSWVSQTISGAMTSRTVFTTFGDWCSNKKLSCPPRIYNIMHPIHIIQIHHTSYHLRPMIFNFISSNFFPWNLNFHSFYLTSTPPKEKKQSCFCLHDVCIFSLPCTLQRSAGDDQITTFAQLPDAWSFCREIPPGIFCQKNWDRNTPDIPWKSIVYLVGGFNPVETY